MILANMIEIQIGVLDYERPLSCVHPENSNRFGVWMFKTLGAGRTCGVA
jgi:hypothetical protein